MKSLPNTSYTRRAGPNSPLQPTSAARSIESCDQSVYLSRLSGGRYPEAGHAS